MAPAPIALILAAGQSRRMGVPKALLELERVPLVRLHVERALALGCARALVIVRPELEVTVAQHLACVRAGAAVQLVSAVTHSQASSLAVLVRKLASVEQAEPESRLLITPVDALPCTDLTFRALCAALGDLTLAVTPRFAGRGGHPVLVRSALLAGHAHGPLDAALPLRVLLEQAGSRRLRVDVEDSSVVADLDTPADAGAVGLRAPDEWLAGRTVGAAGCR